MDAPLPLPLADPIAQVGIPALPGAPVDGEADVAARFATLLELARLTLETDESKGGEPDALPEEREATPPPEAASDALDSLLFLANIAAPVATATPATAAQAAVPDDATTKKVRTGSPSLTLLLPKSPLASAGREIDAAPAGSSTPPLAAGSMPAAASAAVSREDARTSRLEAPLLRAAAPEARAEAAPTIAVDANARPDAKDLVAVTVQTPSLPQKATVETIPGLQHAMTHHAALAPPPALTIDTPVQHPHWREEAAGHIASLVTRGLERAELRVTPPELGPVEVRIDVSGGEATLAIVAAQPATRDALEQALPLLRELLAAHGLTLGEASVRDGRAEREANGNSPSPTASREATDAGLPASTPIALGRRRLVDVFA